MVVALIDTSVVVDMLRKYEAADQWISATPFTLSVSRIVLIETLEGAPSLEKQREVYRLFKRFELVETSVDDIIWATQALSKFGPSHNVDGFDAMIAATSYRLKIPIYTRNLKHFRPMLGDLAQLPYS